MDTDEQEDTYEPIVQARDREAAEEPIHCMYSFFEKHSGGRGIISKIDRVRSGKRTSVDFKDGTEVVADELSKLTPTSKHATDSPGSCSYLGGVEYPAFSGGQRQNY